MLANVILCFIFYKLNIFFIEYECANKNVGIIIIMPNTISKSRKTIRLVIKH